MSSEEENTAWQGYQATYCESCGRFDGASDTILERCEEPVHRLDILEALGFEDAAESVATEVGDCPRCGGQLVKRYYVTGDPPSVDPPENYDPPDNVRSPREDALLFDENKENPHEVREISWIDETE